MPTVAAVTPANGTAAVQGGTPVRVELTRLDSTDYTKVETSQADFAAGTLVNVLPQVGGQLILGSNNGCVIPSTSGGITFASAPTTAVNNITFEAVITPVAGGSGYYQVLTNVGNNTTGYDIELDPSLVINIVNRSVAVLASNYTCVAGVTIRLKVARVSSVWYLWINGVAKTLTNSGASMNTPASAFALGRMTASSSGQNFLGSISEVRLWTINSPSNDITAPVVGNESGLVGAWHCGEGTGTSLFDATSGGRTGTLGTGVTWGTQPPPWGFSYVSSGSRISPAYSLAGVGKFGTGIVQFDTTVPTNTTLVMKISKDGTTWTAVASGDRIALWSEGDDLAAANIYTKAELATTDSAATPVLSEVRLIFMAQGPSLVEIDVGGVACTVANGKLLTWNTRKYASLVLVDPCYRDVFYETVGSWWDDYGPEHVTILVKYNGTTISTTTFDTDQTVSWGASGLETWWWASAIGGVYDGELWGTCWYFASKIEDYLVRGDAHWYVQFPPETTSDAWYWIAHAFRSDTPLAGIVGQPVTHDVPASGVGNCWERSDTPSTGVVQNWTRDDHAASGIVAVVMPPHDEALSGIVGLPLAKDTPAAGIVYEVNANNAIDLRVISVEEAAFLDAMGLLRQ